MDAKQQYDAGHLNDAIAAAGEVVRAKPRDQGARFFLCDLLCFAGEYLRADKQLDALVQLDPNAMLPVALFRQLIRGEMTRQEFFSAGRPPEVVGEVSPDMRLRLQASLQLREGDVDGAGRTLETAESNRPQIRGTCDGKSFDDLRDLDDLMAGVLEVLSPTGKYLWVGFDRLVHLEFAKPEFVRDLMWRRAEIKVADGPEGTVYLPALYPGSAQAGDDQIRLGRMTDWLGSETSPIRGIGQRMLLVANEDRPFLELGRIEFTSQAA